jgi:cytochrome c peroxidase
MRPALLTAIVLLAVGCQPAHRFPPAAKSAEAPPKPATPERVSVSGWLPPSLPVEFDPPIRFVSSRDPQWKALPGFWNRFPPPGAGSATLHVGLDPIGAALAVAAGEGMEAIEVKVPRHHVTIPNDPVKPPTLGRWMLGRKIFSDPVLAGNMACADCHQPQHAFTEKFANSIDKRRTISLVDVAVRTPLFWDGRASRLEEALAPPGASKAHRWNGVADRLDRNEWYRVEFRRLMGIERVTQDAVAKVLATYMRTILAGDSLLDRVDLTASDPSDAIMDLEAILDDEQVRRLNRVVGHNPPLLRNVELASKIATGAGIALACNRCHPSTISPVTPLTFHNILVGDSAREQFVGKETGRFAVLPIGAKDFAMRGAYRAPPLRNLLGRAPYGHDGSIRSLRDMIDHYNVRADPDHPLADPGLRHMILNAGTQRQGNDLVMWNDDEVAALVLYLAAMEGEAVDPIVIPPKESR